MVITILAKEQNMLVYTLRYLFTSFFTFRDENNKELYQAVIVASDELSWKNPKQLTESFCDILGGDGKFKSAMVLGTKELGSVLLSDVSKMNEFCMIIL